MKPEDYELISTCGGFVRAALQMQSYPWSEDIFADLDKRGAAVACKAANGAGKTQCVAAPVALWHASVFPKSLTICTAGVFHSHSSHRFENPLPFSRRGNAASNRSEFSKFQFSGSVIGACLLRGDRFKIDPEYHELSCRNPHRQPG